MPEDKPAALKAADVAPRMGSNYPPVLAARVAGRAKRPLGDPFGLSQFGVNLTTLAPGAASALRHWHEREDEFIYVVEGDLVLVDNAGEHRLTAGMCAGFKAGVANGHQLKNLTDRPATYLEVGSRLPDEIPHYPDDDVKAEKIGGKYVFTRKDGSAY
jgi:uncharacterized cupin superfamily protein